MRIQIWNKGEKCVDWKDSEERRSRCTSTSSILIEYMGEEENVWTARSFAALGLCSVGLASFMNLDDSFEHPTYLQMSEARVTF